MHGIIQLRWYRIPLTQLEYYEELTADECREQNCNYPQVKIVCHNHIFINPGTITDVDQAVARAISDDAVRVLEFVKLNQKLRESAKESREYIERMIFKNRRWKATPPVIKDMIKFIYRNLEKITKRKYDF